MRFVPTLVHAIADYVVGVGMVVLAWFGGASGAGFYAFLILGVIAVCYSLVTDYELGWRPYLSMPGHLAVDAGFAVIMLLLPLLVTLPTLLAFASVAIGLMAAILVATTRMT